MTYDQALSPRLGQRTSIESTSVRMFAGGELPEAAWPGQLIYRIDEQILQVFDGEAWQDVTGGDVGQLTFVGPTVPVAQSVGDIWYNTSDQNRQYVAKSVGADAITTGEWELVSAAPPPITATTQIYRKNTAPGPSDVPPPKYADFWYQTPGNQQYYYDPAAPGNHWIFVQDTGIPQAQSTADSKTTNFVTTGSIPVSLAIGDTWTNKGDNSKVYVARIVGADQITAGEWELSQDWFTANTTAGNAQSTASTKTQSFYQTSPPTSVTAGDIWFDTDDGFKQYRASAAGVSTVTTSPTAGWWLVQDALIPTAVTTANGKNTIYYSDTQPSTPISGTSFVVNDLWFETDNGYAISVWNGTGWVTAPYGGPALATGAVTNREIATSYAYVGRLKADQITTGNISFGIGIAALLRTPGNPGDQGVEIDPTGIRIIGPNDPDDTTTLQPGLSVFKGSAELSTVTIKGDPVTGSAATLRQKTELSRGATFTMSNSVTAPGAAPVPLIDWQGIALTGFNLSGWKVLDLQWDSSISRWVVMADGTSSSKALAYRADGTFDAAQGTDFTYASAGGAVAGVRITGVDNYWLWAPGAGDYYLTNSAQTNKIQFFPLTTSTDYSMCYDGSNVMILESTTPPTAQIKVHKYTTSAVAGANLVPNGTFDVSVITSWTTANVSTSRNTSAPLTGAGSLQAVTNTTVAGSMVSTSFAVTAGVSYKGEFRLKTLGATGTLGLTITWMNASNTVLGTDPLFATAQTSASLVGMQRTAPIGATKATATLTFPQMTGTFLVDDVAVYSAAGLNQVTTDTLTCSSSASVPASGVYVGNGDFGAKQYVVASGTADGNMALVIPDSTKVEVTTNTFPEPAQAPVGIGYDGTAFWTLGSNNTLYKHEPGNKFTTESTTWWAASTYKDTVNGYETGISPQVSFTMKRRARLTLTVAGLNSTGTGDPNAQGVYLARAATAPASTAMHTQGNASANKVVLTTANFASAAPGTTAFPSSSPAEFKSARTDGTGPLIDLKGDGSGRIGQASWDTAGNWVGIGSGAGGGGPADTYTASCSASMDLTTTDTDIPGVSVPVTVADTTDRFLVLSATDYRALTTTNAVATTILMVDSTTQTGNAVFNAGNASASIRATVYQNWVITGLSAGTHTFKLRASVNTGTGEIRAGLTHTRITVVKLVAMKGDPGPQGLQGVAGATGAQGPQGVKGDTGNTGAQGPIGNTGPTGATGSQGIQGIQGPTGATGSAGTPGEKWFSQSGAPAGGTGIVGDWSLDTATGDIYEKTATSTWTLRGNIRGPQGIQGATGATGPQGPQGNDGATGLTGATGPTGATGQAEVWYSGAGAPSGATGAVGDWYLNTSNGDVYEKTGVSTWTQRANIMGPTGPQGPPGGSTAGSVNVVDETTLVRANATQMTFQGVGVTASAGVAGEAIVTVPGTPNGTAGGDLGGTYPNPSVPGLANKINTSDKGGLNGVASLDGSAKVPIAQLPTGTTSSSVTVGDDARLSDARTPTALTHPSSDVVSGNLDTARLGTSPAATTYLKGAASGAAAWVAPSTLKTDLALTKTDVGLSQVQNTDQTNATNITSGQIQDVNRMGQTPTAASYLRAPGTTGSATWTGVTALKSDLAYTKSDVGLSNVDNTSDVNKPISTAVQTALNAASYKAPVRLATTANITLSGAQTIDGFAVVTGDRILVKNQTTTSQNGIYIASTTGAWTRATDANTAALLGGANVSVLQGTANGAISWVTSFASTDTLGSTTMPWARDVDSLYGNLTYAAISHTHVAADTNSGQFMVDRLGTSPAATTYLKGAASAGTGAWASTATVKTDLALNNVPNVDATNASNISSGTLNAARLPGGGQNGQYMSFTSTAASNLTTATFTVIAGWAADAVGGSTGTFISGVSAGSFTFSVAGVYQIIASGSVATGGATNPTRRIISINKSATAGASEQQRHDTGAGAVSGANPVTLQVMYVCRFAVNDIFTIQLWQNSGATITMGSSPGHECQIIRLSD